MVISSGNANAATGARGAADARAMCELVAEGLGVAGHHVLVCSTGLIGIPLPMDADRAGHPRPGGCPFGLGRTSAEDAATGILTTDSGRKEALVEEPGFTVAGMAKGAGMLAPNMATMLAFLTTDAGRRTRRRWPTCSASPCDDSFNSMTVDGCTSTNDTVVLMASGRAGPADPNVVVDAVTEAVPAPGRPDGGRRRRCLQDRPGPGDRGPLRRRGPPGGPQGGRLAAGQVLAQRRGPLLGSGGQ